jgi:hypothetical protein
MSGLTVTTVNLFQDDTRTIPEGLENDCGAIREGLGSNCGAIENRGLWLLFRSNQHEKTDWTQKQHYNYKPQLNGKNI